MLKQARTAIAFIFLMTLFTGIVYPFVLTGLSQLLFSYQANGSLIEKDGKLIGSRLIGQTFTSDKYFHGRPSATIATDPNDSTITIPAPYNAANSGGSNLGPTSQALVDRVKAAAQKLKDENDTPIPVDLVTASGSGLDPDVTPAAAQFQIPRVAKARHLPEEEVTVLVRKYTKDRSLWIFGEPVVNVLELNLALDHLTKASQ